MGQNGSHHTRAVKHRQSTRSLPDVANHRLLDEEARWAAYIGGFYLSAGTTRQADPTGKDPPQRCRSLAPKARKTSALQPCNDQRPNSQSFASFERSYLAKCPQTAANQSKARPGPRSFDSHCMSSRSSKPKIGRVQANAATALHSLGDRRVNPNGCQGDDCNWSDVASDMFRIQKKGNDRCSARHQDAENNARCNGQAKFLRKGARILLNDSSRPNLLGQLPENEPCTATVQSPSARRQSPADQLFFHVDSSDSSLNACGSKLLQLATVGCGTTMSMINGNVEPKVFNEICQSSSTASNECEKTDLQNLRCKLKAENAAKLQLMQRAAAKDRQCIADLQKENQLLRRQQEQLQDENRRLNDEKLQQKAACELCLADVAGKVAKALINEKTLRAECARLRKRLLEFEWKNKIGNFLASNSFVSQTTERPFIGVKGHPQLNAPLLMADQSAAAVTSKISANFTQFDGMREKHLQRDDNLNPLAGYIDAMDLTPGDDYAELLDSHIDGWPRVGPHPLARKSQCSAALSVEALQDVHPSTVTLSPMSSGGEALCSRPTSFNFDAAAAASSSHDACARPPVEGGRSADVSAKSTPSIVSRQLNDVVVNMVHVDLSTFSVAPLLLVKNDQPRLVDQLIEQQTLVAKCHVSQNLPNTKQHRGDWSVLHRKWKSLEFLPSEPLFLERAWESADSGLLSSGTYTPPAASFCAVETVLPPRCCSHLTKFEQDVLTHRQDDTKTKQPYMTSKKDQTLTVPVTGHPMDVANAEPVPITTTKYHATQHKTLNGGLRIKPSHNASKNTSSTSDDSSEFCGEKLLMRERWKQLKRKKNFGKLAVVRYKPSDSRAVILNRGSCMLRSYDFHRFGDSERDALAHFDFLQLEGLPVEAAPMISVPRLSRYDQTAVSKSKPPSSVENSPEESFYENLPFQRFCGGLSTDGRGQRWPSGGGSTSRSPSSDVDSQIRSRPPSVTSSHAASSSSDGGSSLFLSQINLACSLPNFHSVADCDHSFTSESSTSAA